MYFFAPPIMKKVSIIVLLQLLDIAASQTSYGRQFFLGFPRNADVGQSDQISIDIVTRVKAQTVSLTIKSPFQHGLNVNKRLRFTSQITISLLDDYELDFTERDRRGVYIEADHDVAVFVTNVQGDNSGETYAAIPVQGLGNKYVVAAYDKLDYSYPSEFLLVATEDNTAVHMSFPNGSMFFLDIQKYDVYQESYPSGDLSGTVITSNKNVSLFGGATCGELKNGNGPFNGCDFMVDQIPPLNGENRNIEVIIPEIFQQNYIYRVYSENVTSQICHRNKTRGQAECLQSSDFNHNMYESTLTNGTSAVYSTSANFFVALYKDKQGFMMIIPSIEQYLTSYRFLIPSIYKDGQNHYIAVIVPTAEKAGIMLNGQPDSPIDSTQVVSPFQNYTVVTYRVSNLHVYDVTHSAGNVQFGLLCYGYKDGSPAPAYGFAIGFAFGSDDNGCRTSGCEHGGSCVHSISGSVCVCREGFTGSRCEKSANACQHVNCLHNSTCVGGLGEFACVCSLGYSGQYCEIAVPVPCASSPCLNGGSCINNGTTSYTCYCYGNFTGVHCQTRVDECQHVNCLHNSTCVGGFGEFSCVCSLEYSGKHCEIAVPVPCASSPCLNGGSCINNGTTSYTCYCYGNFTGVHCQMPIVHQVTSSLTCYSCEDMSHLELCDHVTKCAQSELCMVQRSGHKYRSGCMSSEVCSYAQTSSDHCLQCCHGNYCNGQGCGDEGIVQLGELRGPMCYDCSHVQTVEECSAVRPCHPDEVCGIEEFEWIGHSHFKLGCVDRACGLITQQQTRSLPICKSCCNEDFCNQNCTRNPTEIIVG